MWSTIFLLLLLLVGASTQYLGAGDVASDFLFSAEQAVNSRDSEEIDHLFSEFFKFEGCKGEYDRGKVIDILSKLPNGTSFSTELLGAQYDEYDVVFRANFTGFEPKPIQAEFVLDQNGDLDKGKIVNCQKMFSDFVSDPPKSSELLVKTFIAKMARLVAAKDVRNISDDLQPGFVFKGCHGSYDKEEFVQLISGLIYDGQNPKIALDSFNDQGASIRMILKISGFDKHDATVKLILNKETRLLESGTVTSCHSRAFRVYPLAPDDVAASFLPKWRNTIGTRNLTAIGGLFDEKFLFKGCERTYDKPKTLQAIAKLPLKYQLNLKYGTGKFIGATTDDVVEFTLIVHGHPYGEFEAQLILHKNVLMSGKIAKCAERRFFRFY